MPEQSELTVIPGEDAPQTIAEREERRQEAVPSPLFGSCPVPIFEHKQIVLGHGSGGKLTSELIDTIFRPAFSNPVLDKLDDQAVLSIGNSRLAFTTDSFVVTPIFFPGGDIGQLAVNGTVNDLAMSGARPLYLAAAFILEEGLLMDDLRRVVESMRHAAVEAGVQFVTGDTKVVDRGKGDQIFITTTGIGILDSDLTISADRARPGDKILLSGFIGDHGMTIMAQRENLEFEGAVESDCASLHGLVAAMLATPGAADRSFLHCLRDPTRGGVATSLNEIAKVIAAWACCCGNRRSPCASQCRARARCWGSTRSMLPMRASCSRSSPPRWQRLCSNRCASMSTAATRPSSAKSYQSIQAWS